MKIRLEHDGTVFEYKLEPLPEGRFKAVCGLFGGGLYVSLALGAAALCGIEGLAAVGVVTVIGMIAYSMG